MLFSISSGHWRVSGGWSSRYEVIIDYFNETDNWSPSYRLDQQGLSETWSPGSLSKSTVERTNDEDSPNILGS
ncbi:hypothetical protein HPP92_006276 [Vanilla planifolia]|uniref:Uncharacterized protein n=1 Tax=Vanilla planifolia TaxID=51239 RepID=A0A835S0C9_VANPL|nr:hypothetical protein HPP92_006276 [Vanilla planifolia]